MVAVISLSRRFCVNPDNVATPIAAALGDLVTLSLLAGVASLLHSSLVTRSIILAILLIYISLIPVSVTPLNGHLLTPLMGHLGLQLHCPGQCSHQ